MRFRGQNPYFGEDCLVIFCNQEVATFLAKDTIAVLGIFLNQEITTFHAENTMAVSTVFFYLECFTVLI